MKRYNLTHIQSTEVLKLELSKINIHVRSELTIRKDQFHPTIDYFLPDNNCFRKVQPGFAGCVARLDIVIAEPDTTTPYALANTGRYSRPTDTHIQTAQRRLTRWAKNYPQMLEVIRQHNAMLAFKERIATELEAYDRTDNPDELIELLEEIYRRL